MNDNNDYLGEYMAECPKCHHRYNKSMHGNKCPDCGYRNSTTLKILPYIVIVLFFVLMIFPSSPDIIVNIINSKNISSIISKAQGYNPVYILMGINVILFIFGWNGNNASSYGNSYNDTIKHGQFYRLLTSGFAHADFLHILCNMWSLYNVGTFAYSILGFWLFLILYFVSMIVGGLLSIIFHHKNDDDETYSIGASGAICGLLGFYIIFIYKLGVDPTTLGQALYQVFAPLLITALNPRIDGLGHLCGLIVGIVLSFLLMSNMGTTKTTSTNNNNIFVMGETVEACYVQLYNDGVNYDSVYVDSKETLESALNEYVNVINEKVKQDESLKYMNGTINNNLSNSVRYSENMIVSKEDTNIMNQEEFIDYLLNSQTPLKIYIECDVTDGLKNYKYIFINDELQSINVVE